jgi:2,3-bisphosphoglycerate-independent phosphoglycerate mutase
MGNSEVGHLNLGAGRIVRMDITRIDTAIADRSFFTHPVLTDAVKLAAEDNRTLHLFGLLSDGGVHSHQRHLYALLKLAAQHKLTRVFIHAFMDGRDTLPTSGLGYLEALEQQIREQGVGQIASVSGRYYAMDRDLRWEKERQAFDAIVTGHPQGGQYTDPLARVRELYNNGTTDEFIPPFTVVDAHNHPIGPVRDNDVCLCFNFRADRVRQITRVLARNSDVPGGLTAQNANDLPKAGELELEIPRNQAPKNIHYVCMTQYDKNFTLPVVIPSESMENLLADVMAQAGLRNLRVAETEKYAHVTYFFNGGIEKPFAGEERILVPSPKVATYDLKPEMSAEGITDAVVKAIEKGEFDAIIMNYANADMVGHSGKLEAAIKAVEAVDAGLGRIYQALKPRGGAWIITADHGNAENMVDPVTGGPHTYHTTNPVPFLCVSENDQLHLAPGGALRDIAPTMLGILGEPAPSDMTGRDLRVTSKH